LITYLGFGFTTLLVLLLALSLRPSVFEFIDNVLGGSSRDSSRARQPLVGLKRLPRIVTFNQQELRVLDANPLLESWLALLIVYFYIVAL
jgi:hypothetical protein